MRVLLDRNKVIISDTHRCQKKKEQSDVSCTLTPKFVFDDHKFPLLHILQRDGIAESLQ